LIEGANRLFKDFSEERWRFQERSDGLAQKLEVADIPGVDFACAGFGGTGGNEGVVDGSPGDTRTEDCFRQAR
jgi:hypothetical protein